MLFGTILILSSHAWIVLCLDCSFSRTYPRQMIAYKVEEGAIKIDGKLNDPAWEEVGWSENFVDISLDKTPGLRTRAKVRWDKKWLYVAAELEEPQIWANISHTCHCMDDQNDQVIFHDNDFEIFIDTDGSNHNYKEFEINAANQTWDLLLNKPYGDGGFENSSRVFGSMGFDMQPPLVCGTSIYPKNALNNPTVAGKYWNVEVALPLDKLLEKSLSASYPKNGDFWRINFSRVEWKVQIMGDQYVKDPAYPDEDNWVWSQQGEINMHLPERWGFLQFSDKAPGEGSKILNPEWTVRQVSMAIYYAEHGFAVANNGTFTDDILELIPYLGWPQPDPQLLLGECASIPDIILGPFRTSFTSTVFSLDSSLFASVTEDRLLTVSRRVLPIVSVVQ